MTGSWNYAPEAKGRVGLNGMVVPVAQPAAEGLLGADLGLVDLSRFAYPDAVAATFRHRNKLT